MPLFSKSRKTLTVSCPYCSNNQLEPESVISTYCRKCSGHFRIIDGLAVAKKTAAFDTSSGTFGSQKYSLSPRAKMVSAIMEEPLGPLSQGFPYHPEGTTTRLCDRDDEIECLDCGHLHSISEGSASSLCPRCGSYTSLKNYHINEKWTRQIRTRGDVHVHKKGSVSATSITCHHLVIDGDFNGAIECQGDLIIRHSCHILGRVQCRRLLVENGANVKCESGITAREVTIDGTVTSDITCEGILKLAPSAFLRGDLNVGKLEIQEGARHEGMISMVTASRT